METSSIDKLIVDFETYWDSKTFTLKKTSMLEYVRDPRFKVFGMGVQWISEGRKSKPMWITGSKCQEFFDTLDWSRLAIVAHNAKFDGFIITEHYKKRPAQWIDTKGMSRAVLGKRIKNHSLSTLATYFGLVSKGTMRTDGLVDLNREQEAELSEYCLHDVELAGQILGLLEKDFPKSQYKMLHETVDIFTQPRIILNTDLLKQTAQQEREKKRTIFEDLQIEKAVFSSNVKFPKLLEKEGFEVPKKISPRTGKEIAAIALGDPDFLDMLEGENERLRTLCEARVAAKSTLLETRSEKLCAIGRTGAWSFDIEYSGANQTHRFSGGKGAGGNPQNFTRGSALRQAVCAPEGFKLIVGDFSNIELRLVAYLSKDPGLIEAIENGVDLYCFFASMFYGRTITKKDVIERMFGKCAILGLGYGMGWKKFKRMVRLQTGLTISEEEAQRAVDLYRERYTQVPQLWYRLNASIATLIQHETKFIPGIPVKYQHEALVLPSGLKMQYPNLRQEDEEWVFDAWGKTVGAPNKVKLYGGKILENISQGLAGELCKEVAEQFAGSVTGLVHDEVHLLARTPLAETMRNRLHAAMTTAPIWMPKLNLKAEVGIGSNWLDAK